MIKLTSFHTFIEITHGFDCEMNIKPTKTVYFTWIHRKYHDGNNISFRMGNAKTDRYINFRKNNPGGSV